MFDTALIESAAHPAGAHGRHARTLTAAIAFHSAVIGALVLAALASTGEPPEPAIPIVFPAFSAGLPPPPSGGTPIRTSIVPRTRVDAPPVRIPDLPVANAVEAPPETGPLFGEDAGDSPGDGMGGQGGPGGRNGVPGSPGEIEGGGLADQQIYQPHVGGVTAPELVFRIDPIYPEPSRKLHQQGVVILEAVITAAGSVDQLRIVGSAGALLDAAAATAVRQWRYEPATLNGRAVAVFLTVTVRFALNG